jgi:hypothetical protein
VNEVNRAAAMAERLQRATLDAGVHSADSIVIVNAYRTAMELRADTFPDTHPDALHPGRTALILLQDVGVREATEISAAILFDSLYPELTVDEQRAEATAGSGATALLERLRRLSDPTELLERLLSDSDQLRRAALAERLDHARHLHLRPDASWRAFHQEIRDVYLPIASRTHPVLERRFAWWTETFQRRFLHS